MKSDQKNIRTKRDLFSTVKYILKRKKDITKLTQQYKAPFYAFDREALDKSIDSLLTSFKKEIPLFKAYYALKINNHPFIVDRVVEKGLGIDAGSPREIELAIKAGCKDVVYFSPGKTESDILYALKYNEIITIHIDSFNELEILGNLTTIHRKKIKAGVRIYMNSFGDWKKYGISIDKLDSFWEESSKYPFLDLQGIHFHISRNKDASFYEKSIKELGVYLSENFSKQKLESIKYIDFGGGFEVHNSEGVYLNKKNLASISYKVNDVPKIEVYASKIGSAIRKYLYILPDVTYYSEPGRFICNSAMHVVLSVVDIKDESNIVLNGGVNMVGWQRFEHEYFPLVNISSPSKKEKKCNMWGHLCTTWDTWGYFCFSKNFSKEDIIVIPNQGALTYSLAQNFIYSIPPVYKL